MTIYRLPEEIIFPSPEYAEPDGLLAVGGDLSPERLLLAYQNGIFPWYSDGDPILWWSPDPRLVLYPEKLKVSKSLKRTIKKGKFEIRFDTNFRDVISNCATNFRKGQDGTWITEEMREAYCHMYELGFAHSVEAYLDNELVGGLYGLALGECFFGESMFTLVPDASKVAFAHLVDKLKSWGFRLIDCQVSTSHLLSLGAEEITRGEFLEELDQLDPEFTIRGVWKELE